MKIWIAISLDEYELPEAVADSPGSLAEICGVKPSTVTTSASRARTGNTRGGFCRFRSVDVTDDD